MNNYISYSIKDKMRRCYRDIDETMNINNSRKDREDIKVSYSKL